MGKNNHNFFKAYRYREKDPDRAPEYLRTRLNNFRPYLGGQGKLLELGCGNGLLGEILKKETLYEIYGADISKSGIRLARKSGIRAKIADLNEKLPYKDNYFDRIVSDQVIEHIYNTDHLIDEIHRILKPGGVCMTITPNLSFWLNRILFVFGFYPIFLECGEKYKDYGMMPLKFFIKDKYAVGHVRIFNLLALEDIFMRHKFIIRMKKGLPLSWQLPPFLKYIYEIIDGIFSRFPSLSRDILLVTEKKQ